MSTIPQPTRLLLILEGGEASGLATALEALGHQVESACMPDALARVRTRPYDAILVQDIPAVSRLRAEGLLCPVLALGTSTATADLIRALDAGADEYVLQPAHPGEVAARIRALLRRVPPQHALQLTRQNLTLKLLQREAYVRGRPLRCTPKEFELLLRLVRQPHAPVSRSELLRALWAPDGGSNSNVVEVHLSRLRAKLREAGADVTITSVRGAGFHLGDVATTAPPSDRADVA